MELNTKLTLIEHTVEAFESNDPVKLMNAEKLLRVKCHQYGMPLLRFVVNEIAPLVLNRVSLLEKKVKYVSECPYCNQRFRNSTGLKSHLGKKHQALKNEWTMKI